MEAFRRGWAIQWRVIHAMMLRELTTRYGRDNIGFLWIMVEPLLFAVFVGILWRYERGETDHSIGIFAFVASGYLPMVMFRSTVSRATGIFQANSSLLYHRQVKILDLVVVRFLVELIGHMMAFLFIWCVFMALGLASLPYDVGFLLLGWLYFSLFTFAVATIAAPLSQMSEVVEKFVPISTYMMVPFSGAFFLADWLTPDFRAVVLYSPPVHGMEMLRYGLFGPVVYPYYSYTYPLAIIGPLLLIGLALCRHVRRTIVVE